MSDVGSEADPVVVDAPRRRVDPSWALLAVLAIVAAVLVTVVVQADIESIADDGWQDNAYWAAGLGIVLLGLALAAVAWTLATDAIDSVLTRTAVLAAVFGMIGSVVVVGIADQRGGEESESAAQVEAEEPEGTESTDDAPADEPIGLREAFEPENLVPSAIPIVTRTTVELQLTVVGRRLLARAMGCQPADLRDNRVIGTAIGGTWAQPLINVSPPVNEDDEFVARCQRILIRLPLEAGFAQPI